MRGPSFPSLPGNPFGGHVGQSAADLLDGRLSAEQERRVRLHLGGCPSCATTVHAAQDARRALRRAAGAPIGPSDDLMAGLLALSLQEPSPMSASGSRLAPRREPTDAGVALSRRSTSRRPVHGLRGAVLVSTVLVSTVAVVAVGTRHEPSPAQTGLLARDSGLGTAVRPPAGPVLGPAAAPSVSFAEVSQAR